jgi:hypothetical protein
MPADGSANLRESGALSIARANRYDAQRDSGWRADVDSLVETVRQRHWRYRDVPLPPDFVMRASTLRAEISNLGDDEIVVRMQGILATLRDGHTLIYPFGMKRGALAHLPIVLYEFRDGLAVIAADSAHSFLLGKRVRRLGGISADSISSRFAPMLSLENESQLRWAYPLYATFPAFARLAGIAKQSAEVDIIIHDGQGEKSYKIKPDATPLDPGKLVIGLLPAPTVAAPPYLANLGTAYWLTTLDEGRVVYVQVNRVTSDSAHPLDRFASQMLDSLMRPRTQALVVDLRNNNGGNASVLPPLIRAIAAFRALKPNAPIYVTIGRQTFSAAQTLVNRLEEYCDPIFVGEETGSKPNRFGNGAGFRLPYSGVMGEISTGYNQGATSRDTRTATAPSIRVTPTLADWLAGRDVALDSVLSLIHAHRPGAD